MIDLEAAARAALERLLARAPHVRVAVVGDVMLDEFLYGAVERISPEAPVPVVDVEREVAFPGGAANVVRNLRALSAQVDLYGAVGADGAAERIRAELRELGLGVEGLVEVAGRPTAIKTRVIAQHQQVVRFDRERRGDLPCEARLRLQAVLAERLGDTHAVVVSDYGKGVVGSALMAAILGLTRPRGVLVAVDPKPGNAACYDGVDVITPNVKETEAMTGLPARSDAEAEAAGRALLERHGARSILVTRGERGMTLVTRGEPVVHIPTWARDVFDVTGAGDTAISVLTLAWAAGAAPAEAAALANLAAGIVVGKLGTAVVGPEELARAAAHRPTSRS